jgi:hypothetical protein
MRVSSDLLSDLTMSTVLHTEDLKYSQYGHGALVLPRDSIISLGRITFPLIFPISLSQFQPIPCVLSLHFPCPFSSAATSRIYRLLFSISLPSVHLQFSLFASTFDSACKRLCGRFLYQLKTAVPSSSDQLLARLSQRSKACTEFSSQKN